MRSVCGAVCTEILASLHLLRRTGGRAVARTCFCVHGTVIYEGEAAGLKEVMDSDNVAGRVFRGGGSRFSSSARKIWAPRTGTSSRSPCRR
eukprot:2278644-Rhodomonas_salina.3